MALRERLGQLGAAGLRALGAVGEAQLALPGGRSLSLDLRSLKLRLFARAAIPLLAWVRPGVVMLDGQRSVVRLPLDRRTRNHLGSMYFGALCIGAETAAGLPAMDEIERFPEVALIFKDFSARFLRRAEGEVHFECAEAASLRAAVRQAAESGERVERSVPITARVPSRGPEPVAEFTITISLRRRRTT